MSSLPTSPMMKDSTRLSVILEKQRITRCTTPAPSIKRIINSSTAVTWMLPWKTSTALLRVSIMNTKQCTRTSPKLPKLKDIIILLDYLPLSAKSKWSTNANTLSSKRRSSPMDFSRAKKMKFGCVKCAVISTEGKKPL